MPTTGLHKMVALPRILAIGFALFLMLFSFDVFESGVSAATVLGFFIHSIPTMFMLMAMVLTWKRPIVTGAVYILLGLVFLVRFKTYDAWLSFFIISVLPAFIGVLYLIAGLLKAPAPPPETAAVPEEPKDTSLVDDTGEFDEPHSP